jgi:hypothetical protein
MIMSDETNNPTDRSAYDNASITIPSLKRWGSKTFYDHEEMIVDYETLEELNNAVNAARKALFIVTDKINKYDRLEREARIEYDRTYRRAYIASSEKTENAKKARAELMCEELENKYIAHEQLKVELGRLSQTLRLELQTLQAVGNNLRQQMKME